MSNTQLSFWRKYIFSTDHKMIGAQYTFTGLLMVFVAGYMAYVFRMQLAFPGQHIPLYGILNQQTYNSLVTMHGLIMFFWVAMPVILAGMGNFLIPMMLGTDDMAFPRINMLSYWVFFISTVVLGLSFLVPSGPFAGGWTMYPPLSADAYAGTGSFLELLMTGGSLIIIAIALEFIAILMGGINFVVTFLNKRAPGMSLMRVPIVIWCLIIASVLFMFSVGPLLAGAAMLFFDRTLGTGFFNPAKGGDPLLFQHLFWFFGHPEVYVVFLPGLGAMAEVMTTFARKPLFGYKMIVYMLILSGFLSFIVWAHHQFVAGIDPRMANFFVITTILISIPFAHIFFAYLATFWGGSIRFTTPMLFAIGFVLTFLVGGVTGIYLGASSYDIYSHDTYFVVAHFHFIMASSVFFGGLSAFYYWFPKFTGRMMGEKVGKVHFFLTFVSFSCIFLPLFILGVAGEHRRIFDYSMFPGTMRQPFTGIRIMATLSAIVLISSQFLFVYNLIHSFFRGEKASKNPWDANSLEWLTESPPPHGNFTSVPVVHRGPYEYSVPGRDLDYWPQDSAP